MIAPGQTVTRTWTPASGPTYDYEAFIPAPLTVRVPQRWASDVVDAVESAGAALRRLPTEQSMPGLAVHLGRAEAGGSSMIEGHFVQPRRLFEMQLEPDVSTDTKTVPVFRNWELLLRARAATHLSSAELCGWHGLLMEHDPQAVPGHHRAAQNWIGGDGWGPRNASYVPPPPEHVTPLMEDLVDYGNEGVDHPVVKAAILHAQFESIHPFVDGNGRVGRAFIHWALRNLEPSVPPLALVWYAHGDRYFVMLDGWRANPDPGSFVTYFCESLVSAVGAADVLMARLDRLRVGWAQVISARSGSLKRRMVDDLATNPIVDVRVAAERYDAGPSRFSRVARELVESGILTETKLPRRRAGRPRTVYEAGPVFDVLNEFVAEFRAGVIPSGSG